MTIATVRRVLLLAIGLILFASVGRRTENIDDVPAVAGGADLLPPADTDGIDDQFIYETIARYDDRVQSKIDAADGAIVSVLAANGAVVLFEIDKIKELERVNEHTATYLIIASTGIGLLGYLVGLFWPLRADQFSPSAFLKRATFEPSTAISEATSDLVDASHDNERVLFAKRLVIVVAIGLLIGAVAAVTQARVHGT